MTIDRSNIRTRGDPADNAGEGRRRQRGPPRQQQEPAAGVTGSRNRGHVAHFQRRPFSRWLVAEQPGGDKRRPRGFEPIG
jgi:hypothetical protein